VGLLIAVLLSFPPWCAAQQPAPADTPQHSQQGQSAPETPATPTAPGTKGFYGKGWRDLGPNLLRDQASIWLFPVSVARGHHVKPTLALAGVTAALIGVDKYPAGYFQRTNSFNGFNRTFSGSHTALAAELVPAALYAVGLIRRDKYAQETFVLAGRAVLDSELLTIAMKDVDRRSGPAGGHFSDTWFVNQNGNYLRGAGSFPSGHTIAAFAIATTYAERYPHPRWVPWVAYGLAGLVGFSRLPTQAHYASDVFAGAALGYVITRYVVLRPR
jgi:PAP2 superfamily